MMISVVLSVYVMYILYLNSLGTNIPKIKPTVRSSQKAKRLKVRLSGGVFFDKNNSNKDSPFVSSNEEKAEGGFGICNEW